MTLTCVEESAQGFETIQLWAGSPLWRPLFGFEVVAPDFLSTFQHAFVQHFLCR